MVMDASQTQQPSPQSVGREFVRQYYTLLNKAPNHLHRFYNNNSSFIHDETSLAVGQKNIHNCIQQLNFHDCHAKISQVDAQATLGTGVVVQVTGELSNDGQPMRRFTQTFVLAAQSPKKYYVHNDIFRYQDLYSDEDNEPELRPEHEDAPIGDQQPPSAPLNAVAEQPQQQQQQQQQLPAQVVGGNAGVLPPPQQTGASGAPQQTIYFSMPPSGGRPLPMMSGPQGAGVPQMSAPFAGPGAPPQQQQPQVAAVSQLNGVVGGHDDLLAVGGQPPMVVAPSGSPIPVALSAPPTNVGVVSGATNATTTTGGGGTGYQQSGLMQPPLLQSQPPQHLAAQPNLMQGGTNAGLVEPDTEGPGGPVPPTPTEVAAVPTDDFKTINEQQQQEKYEAVKQQQNEPKTYANLFKSTSSSPSGFVTAAMQQQQQLQQQSNVNYQSNAAISSTTFTQSNTSMGGYRNANNNNSGGDNNMGGPLPQRNNMGRMNKDFEQRRSSNFGDNQQLFLGNIPHHATEDDLKAIFSRFGSVVELKILTKPGAKQAPNMRNPLNYGFITYEDADSVQNCLAHCPLYFPENSPDGQKLNVEEKKPRMRTEFIPRQSGGGPMNNNNSMNNARGNNMSGGGPPQRSLSGNNGGTGGGGGLMRNNGGGVGGNMPGRGGGAGPRLGGGSTFSRSGGPSNGGGHQMRTGVGSAQTQTGGGTYGGRR